VADVPVRGPRCFRIYDLFGRGEEVGSLDRLRRGEAVFGLFQTFPEAAIGGSRRLVRL